MADPEGNEFCLIQPVAGERGRYPEPSMTTAIEPSASTVPPDEGRSWWLREALALPEFAGDDAPALQGDTTADVVILGGGYTGLWTAWSTEARSTPASTWSCSSRTSAAAARADATAGS